MSSNVKEFYRIIIDAQESDASGDHKKAFVQYLDGICALSSYMKHEANDAKVQTLGSSNCDAQLIHGVNTLKHCIDRLQDICNSRPSNDAIDGLGLSKLTIPSPTQMSSLPSNYSLPNSPIVCTALDKAYKENAVMNKIFNNRLRNMSDPTKIASLQLELQRRLTENIQLAKVKDADKYHEQNLRERKALEEAAIKLLEKQHLLNLDIDSHHNQQHLYAQILQYETNHKTISSQFRCYTLNPDPKVFDDITMKILSLNEHPLCKNMKKFQYQIQRRYEPLLNHYLNEKITREEHSFLEDTESFTADLINNDSCVNNEVIIIDKLESEALIRHFNNIANDVSSTHETITLMLTLIMFENHQYYTPANSDILQRHHHYLHSIVADYLYPPIWGIISNLYRFVYYKYEETLKMSMQETYLFNELEKEWTNVDPKVIEEIALSLRSIIPLQTPHAKLKSMVRLTQRLCTKLKESGISAEIGADDLVPVLCLVALKSASPQLISECMAIEQLIDGKYLLGEEGYCLSSIQTALKYIELNAKNHRIESSSL